MKRYGEAELDLKRQVQAVSLTRLSPGGQKGTSYQTQK